MTGVFLLSRGCKLISELLESLYRQLSEREITLEVPDERAEKLLARLRAVLRAEDIAADSTYNKAYKAGIRFAIGATMQELYGMEVSQTN